MIVFTRAFESYASGLPLSADPDAGRFEPNQRAIDLGNLLGLCSLNPGPILQGIMTKAVKNGAKAMGVGLGLEPFRGSSAWKLLTSCQTPRFRDDSFRLGGLRRLG